MLSTDGVDPSTRTDLGWFAATLVVLTGVPLTVVIASGATGGAWFVVGTSAPTLVAALLWLLGRRRTGRRSRATEVGTTRDVAPRGDGAVAPRGDGAVALRGVGGTLRWVAAAVVLGAAPAVVAVLVAVAVDGRAFDPAQPARLVGSAGGPLLALLAFLAAGPLAEEFGWRGYLQPRLRRFLSPVATSVTLGTVWAAWHLPLFAVAGTGQSGMGPARAVLYLVTFLPMAFLFWFVSEHLRGGVAAAVVMHLAFNASQALLRPADPQAATAVVAITATVLAVGTYLAVRVRGSRPGAARRPARRAAGRSRSGSPASLNGPVAGVLHGGLHDRPGGIMSPHAPRTRAVCAVAGMAVVASVLAACGIGPTYRVEDDATVNQPVTAIRLDGRDGGVTVDGRPGTTAISLHRRIDSPNQSAPGPTYRIEGGTLVLADCGDDCSVEYTLVTPPGLPVSGRTTAGAVSLNGVAGVDVGTDSGGVTLSDVGGPTKVETTNGAVRGSAIRGSDLQVTTSNGDIDLAPATAQNIRAETGNGRITLTVPSASYQVAARTSNGSQRIDVPDDPAGRFRLDLTTSNGDITVRQG